MTQGIDQGLGLVSACTSCLELGHEVGGSLLGCHTIHHLVEQQGLHTIGSGLIEARSHQCLSQCGRVGAYGHHHL